MRVDRRGTTGRSTTAMGVSTMADAAREMVGLQGQVMEEGPLRAGFRQPWHHGSGRASGWARRGRWAACSPQCGGSPWPPRTCKNQHTGARQAGGQLQRLAAAQGRLLSAELQG